MLPLKEQVKYLEKNLPGCRATGMQFLPFGTQQDLQRQILGGDLRALLPERSAAGKREGIHCPLQGGEKPAEPGGAGNRAAGRHHAQRIPGAAKESARLKAHGGHAGHTRAVRMAAAQTLDRAHAVRASAARAALSEGDQPAPGKTARAIRRAMRSTWRRCSRCCRHGSASYAAQQGEADPRVDDFGWMLQELRVSLFAQELKTPVIVSVKRLEKMLAGLRG